eukprot:CAMPEP_0115127304 /NCGR_PEP_ID=MMETSP0227-20121206/50298_1 /TAXON_ID=89957 /ORGANISM="Polarella glacialis, Strain CCMP 1383" /LENGTH=47 /DNA_ID= /DNA_START= /DNA_END= /DNA_ORIENTATION=
MTARSRRMKNPPGGPSTSLTAAAGAMLTTSGRTLPQIAAIADKNAAP